MGSVLMCNFSVDQYIQYNILYNLFLRLHYVRRQLGYGIFGYNRILHKLYWLCG